MSPRLLPTGWVIITWLYPLIKSCDSNATRQQETGDITSSYGQNQSSPFPAFPWCVTPHLCGYPHIYDFKWKSTFGFKKNVLQSYFPCCMCDDQWWMIAYDVCFSSLTWNWGAQSFLLFGGFSTNVWTLTLGFVCQACTTLLKKHCTPLPLIFTFPYTGLYFISFHQSYSICFVYIALVWLLGSFVI